MYINDLENFRYSITGIKNDVFPSLFPMAQVSPTLPCPPLTHNSFMLISPACKATPHRLWDSR